MKQTTSQILLVKPANFGFNEETAESNAFQNRIKNNAKSSSELALQEFGLFVEKLERNGINVTVIEDTLTPVKPDAIFPNNWISMHEDGKIILYPMCAPNRRLEKRHDVVEKLKKSFLVKEVIDFSVYENENRFLEGTGSIIFDHVNKKAYACISPRTDKGLLTEVCRRLNYEPISFFSLDENGQEIYHTNVMMCIGEKFAVICLESIKDEDEKNRVTNSLKETGHEIIDVSYGQMKKFAGNMLALTNNEEKNLLGMSQSAFNSLTQEQKNALKKYTTLLPLPIRTIETIGGGSARCMMAEIFLQKK